MDCKRVAQNTLLDRISELPNNVIDIILNHVSLRDAVRTSILSTNWRLHWTRVENLVLDDHFFYDVLPDRRHKVEVVAAMYKGIVGNIISSHQGPIRKFVLHIPDIGDTRSPDIGDTLSPDVINLWILAVSRCGVQELTLRYVYEDLTLDYDFACDNKVPTYVFHCVELKHLSLKGVQGPPNNFRQLSSLLSLDLCCETIEGDLISNIFLSCPLLERFSLDCNYDYGFFSVDASKLKLLHVKYYYYMNFILVNTPKLSAISLNSSGWEKTNIECQGMLDFFGAVPKIENITLSDDVLEKWAGQDVPNRLPAALENHLNLTVCQLNIYSEAQIRSMFCLMKSSPKLQKLDISINRPCMRFRGTWDYLRSQMMKGESFWSLRTVKVSNLMGVEPEIVLVELILSYCPVLEKLYLSGDYCLRSGAELKMVTDIMRFRRASTQAELIYSKSY